jgi:hypothetical protein
MVDLLYLSHTAVPSHLSELDGLGLLEEGEQVLVALDGVLLDSNGRRIGGPTLHDYCLLTNQRILLWARDYGRHLCYDFPLTELCMVEGTGLDPMHAHLHLSFAAPEEEEQHFALILLPLMDLGAAVTMLQLAAKTALELAERGLDPRDSADEVTTALGMHIFGTEDGKRPAGRPHRSADWEERHGDSVAPPFQGDQMGVPIEFYSAGRLGRAAWDTFRRTLRETEMPFNLNNSDLHDVADTLRALNELLSTLAGNPGARELAMAFLNNRRGGSGGEPKASAPSSPAAKNSDAAWNQPSQQPAAGTAEEADYHEIPLRQRKEPERGRERERPNRVTSRYGQPEASSQPEASQSTGIPLRRRGETNRPATNHANHTASASDSEHTTIPLRRRNASSSNQQDDADAAPVDAHTIPLRRGKNGQRPSVQDSHQHEV